MVYQPIVEVLADAICRSRTDQMVDLGSGGDGGWIWLNDELRKQMPESEIVLTDYFPNLPAFEYTAAYADNIRFAKSPVDARDVSSHLRGLRTQFLSLHDFKDKDGRKIPQNAVDSQSSIAIFEAQERSLSSLIAMLFSPLSVLLCTPFIRPFRLWRIVFTYLIPIIPVVIVWDGVVSALRTYSLDEMQRLVESVKRHESFDWQIERATSGLAAIPYLIGTPKAIQ